VSRDLGQADIDSCAYYHLEDEDDESKSMLLWFTRIVLGVQVTSAAVTLPSAVLLKQRMYKSLSILLLPVMGVAVVTVALFAKA
jgi:hypothetical protein